MITALSTLRLPAGPGLGTEMGSGPGDVLGRPEAALSGRTRHRAPDYGDASKPESWRAFLPIRAVKVVSCSELGAGKERPFQ